MSEQETKRIRVEAWIQFAILVVVLTTALLATERRLTRVETLIQTYETRLSRVETMLQRQIERNKE